MKSIGEVEVKEMDRVLAQPLADDPDEDESEVGASVRFPAGPQKTCPKTVW